MPTAVKGSRRWWATRVSPSVALVIVASSAISRSWSEFVFILPFMALVGAGFWAIAMVAREFWRLPSKVEAQRDAFDESVQEIGFEEAALPLSAAGMILAGVEFDPAPGTAGAIDIFERFSGVMNRVQIASGLGPDGTRIWIVFRPSTGATGIEGAFGTRHALPWYVAFCEIEWAGPHCVAIGRSGPEVSALARQAGLKRRLPRIVPLPFARTVFSEVEASGTPGLTVNAVSAIGAGLLGATAIEVKDGYLAVMEAKSWRSALRRLGSIREALAAGVASIPDP